MLVEPPLFLEIKENYDLINKCMRVARNIASIIHPKTPSNVSNLLKLSFGYQVVEPNLVYVFML